MLVIALRGNGLLGNDLAHFLDLIARLVVARVQSQGNVEVLNVVMGKHSGMRVLQGSVNYKGMKNLRRMNDRDSIQRRRLRRSSKDSNFASYKRLCEHQEKRGR